MKNRQFSKFLSTAGFFIFVLSFFSCVNTADFLENEKQAFFPVFGRLVLPSGFEQAEDNGFSARTAMPDFSSAAVDYKYEIVAKSKTDASITINGRFESGKDFLINLPEGEWILEATGNVDGHIVLKGESDPVEISRDKPIYSNISVELSPFYGEGSGIVQLALSIENGTKIKSVKTKWTLIYASGNQSGSTSLDDDAIEVSGDSATIKKENVPSGSYSLSLFFYDNDLSQGSVDSNLLFMIQEEINVFSEMTTDTWQGKAEYFAGADENKTLKITAEMVENWRSSTFYVGKHGSWQANDNNTGSYFAPLATLQKAVEKIKSSEKQGGYTICVSGTVNGSADFSSFSTLPSSVSVKIKAFSGSGVSSAKATIKSTNQQTIKLSSKVSLTLENLTLSGGDKNSDGSIISVDNGAVVTLDSCTITGNTVGPKGAVYVQFGGIFKVKGNTNITGNMASSQAANVYLAGATDSNKGTVSFDSSVSSSLKIGVTTEQKPGRNSKAKITSLWNSHKGSVNPYTVFTSDEGYAVTTDVTNEVALAVSGGTLNAKPQPVVKLVFANCGEGEFYETSGAKAKKKATIKKSNIGTGSGKYSKIGIGSDGITNQITGANVQDYNMEIYYNGVKIKTEAASTDSNNITSVKIKSTWPVGNYQVIATAKYDGMTYSAVMELVITE